MTHDVRYTVCETKRYDLVIYDSICLAVRDRSEGVWLDEHYAIDERVALEPRARNSGERQAYDLVVFTIGMQLVVGEVLVVRGADAGAEAQIERASSRRSWMRKVA